MSVKAQELEVESGYDEAGAYPSGGEVSAMTLISDVRAIRQRLDSVEVALRGLGTRMEELKPGAVSEGGAAAPAPGSLDELRKALTGDLQADLHKNAKRSTMLMGVILLVMLAGLGGLGWMLHQLE